MDLFDLVAKISLDSSEYEKGLDDAKNKAGGFGDKLKSAGAFAGKALAAAGAAATTFAGVSVKAGMDFDSAMSQVAATMGTTVDNIQNLRDFAQEMGSTTAFSATQAAEALNYMALAGYDAETSMEMLPTVLDLAAAGGIDLASASDMVTDAQSALGLSLEETAAMVDQMAAASSASNTSVAQLGEALLTLGATGRNVSGGTEELSTVLGVLADNGIKGAEGGTHLRNILLSLQNPTDDAAEMLNALGIAVYDADGNMRSMIDIVEDLQGSLDGMDQASKDAVVSGIFNKTDLAAVNALLGTSSERFDELSGKIDNSAGAAERMANTQLDNLAGDITLFKSALEGAEIAISDGITPTLREFVQFATDGISNVTTAFKEEGLSGALNALGDIISKGIDLVFSVLPTITTAGISLLEALVSGILENLPALITAASQIILSLAGDIVDNLPKLIDATAEIIFALADGIIDAIPQLIPAIVAVILTIVEKLTEPNTIMQLIAAAFEIINAVAQGLIDAIPEIIKAVPTIMLNLIEAILRFLPQILASGVQLVAELGLGIVRGGANVIKGFVDLFNNIGNLIHERIENAKTWGSDLIHNFINGIVGQAQALWNTIKDIGQGIRNLIGFSEPKEGPLSNFHTYAPDMMKLFAKGIKDNENLVTDQLEKSFDFESTITPTVKGVSSGGTSGSGSDGIINIVVQSVLDGRVIGETAYKYQRGMARAIG